MRQLKVAHRKPWFPGLTCKGDWGFTSLVYQQKAE